MSLLDNEDVLLKEELEQLKEFQLEKIKKFCYSHIGEPLYDYLFQTELFYIRDKTGLILKPSYKLKLEWDESQYKYYFVPEDPKHPGLMKILNIDSIEDIPNHIRVKNVKFILD